MSDEVYQGDNNSEYIIEDIVNDLDLFEVSMKYKKLWELREHTPSHFIAYIQGSVSFVRIKNYGKNRTINR
jgi:hypothetical protein